MVCLHQQCWNTKPRSVWVVVMSDKHTTPTYSHPYRTYSVSWKIHSYVLLSASHAPWCETKDGFRDAERRGLFHFALGFIVAPAELRRRSYEWLGAFFWVALQCNKGIRCGPVITSTVGPKTSRQPTKSSRFCTIYIYTFLHGRRLLTYGKYTSQMRGALRSDTHFQKAQTKTLQLLPNAIFEMSSYKFTTSKS